jgi:hypothetical protein
MLADILRVLVGFDKLETERIAETAKLGTIAEVD